MTTKPKLTQTGYEIVCPRCQRQHMLDRISETRLVLDGDAHDEFRVTSGQIYPDWVCRNHQCRAAARLLVDE